MTSLFPSLGKEQLVKIIELRRKTCGGC